MQPILKMDSPVERSIQALEDANHKNLLTCKLQHPVYNRARKTNGQGSAYFLLGYANDSVERWLYRNRRLQERNPHEQISRFRFSQPNAAQKGRGQDTPKQANLLPSHPELRTNEQDRVLHDLRANGYPDILLKCIRDRTKERPTQERPLGLAVVPYVRGASDRVGRVLKKFRVRTAFKPVRTLGHVFRKPKDRPVVNRMAGIVYKVKCHDCSFTYIGESKRLWSSRGAEHDPGRASNSESAIKQHAESTDLRAWCYQLQQEAFLGVVALHFGQQCYQRKQSFSSRFCAVNSKLKCHTNAQFGSASTNKLSLTLMKVNRCHRKF
ncbi:hypothetical protein ACROYT_G035332 [Oculina patagonica]